MDIIFDIPASVKSLKNYVTGSRKTFNDKVHIFFLTPLKWAIHAFVNVFLSGIHSRLEQDLRIYLSPWHVSLLLPFFSLNCAPDGFCLFIILFFKVSRSDEQSSALQS